LPGDGGKFSLAGADKGRIGAALGTNGSGGDQHVRAEVFECRQPDGGLEHDHAGVPVVAALIEVGLGSCGVGFFDKAHNDKTLRQHTTFLLRVRLESNCKPVSGRSGVISRMTMLPDPASRMAFCMVQVKATVSATFC